MRKKREKKRTFDIKEEYKKSWRYIRESKKFIFATILIFLVFTFLGFFIAPPESVKESILQFIQELLEQTKDMSVGEMIQFIFLNNLQASFFAMAFGVLFGIFPAILAVVNGYILGFVSAISVEAEGFLSLLKIFPHGIFELPAVFISFGLGMKLGSFLFQKEKIESLKYFLSNSLRIFLLVIIPLLIIAAIIEGILIFL